MSILDRLARLARSNVTAVLSRAGGKDVRSGKLHAFTDEELEAELERRRKRQSESKAPPSPEKPAPDETLAGYYRLLELPYGADLKAVKHAYRRLLAKYHPDRHANDPEKQRMANELTQALNHAFDQLEAALSNHEKPK